MNSAYSNCGSCGILKLNVVGGGAGSACCVAVLLFGISAGRCDSSLPVVVILPCALLVVVIAEAKSQANPVQNVGELFLE